MSQLYEYSDAANRVNTRAFQVCRANYPEGTRAMTLASLHVLAALCELEPEIVRQHLGLEVEGFLELLKRVQHQLELPPNG